MNNNNNISPWYISGLTQADGSFFCVVSKKANALFGLQFRPKFTLTQDLDSISVLELIQQYFGCGKIYINRINNSAELVVNSKLDLINIIIPHFVLYPVVLDKLHSFNLFKQVVEILFANTHRSARDRASLLNMVLSMNSASQRSVQAIDALYAHFGISNGSAISLIPNICTTIANSLHPAFIMGYIDGDGSFSISFNYDGSIKPVVTLVGYVTVAPLLESIMATLSNIGSIAVDGELARWFVVGAKQIRDILIPFVDTGCFHTEKAKHYRIFREVCLS